MTFDDIRASISAISPAASPAIASEVQQRLDSLTKPQGSLGRLEDIVLRVAQIQGVARPSVSRKKLAVFCGDHGVVEEGISAFSGEVTRQMAANFVRGGAAINVLCRLHGIECAVVDVGISGGPVPGAIGVKIGGGAANFTRQAAMTRAQAEAAIAAGFAHASDAGLLGAGEMGIGNTTSATAILCAFTGFAPEDCAGRGAGLDAAGVRRKAAVVRRGLELHKPQPSDPVGVLAAVGGFEIAALTGFFLGAAARRIPVVADGFITGAALLAARALAPSCLDYVFFSHCSAEQAHATLLQHLGVDPLFDLGMRLGEGSAAALGMHLIETALALYSGMATFAEASVSGKSS